MQVPAFIFLKKSSTATTSLKFLFLGVVQRKSKDLYEQRQLWRLVLIFIATGIVVFSVFFTYSLARQIEKDEKEKVEAMASAYRTLVLSTDEAAIEEALNLIRKNDKIPVIWTTAEGELYDFKNIDSASILGNSREQYQYLLRLMNKNQVVPIQLEEDQPPQLLYYEASDLLKRVRIYPYLLVGLVALFLLIAFLAFSFSRTAEQNQLWVGMAKETAHQLGTPLSSLSAWLDILEDKLTDDEGIMIKEELRKDLLRLELVADRFSKIGSKPALEELSLAPIIGKSASYMQQRASRAVQISLTDLSDGDDTAMFNPPLFEWVLENLIKNALDAMESSGSIEIILQNQNGWMMIDVKDSGKGIPANKFNAVFEPGYSTKLRGWGLGLTLTKRIIEQYHDGKIFVKESTPGKGTTFRIQLKKA
jgi:signal transduction histidine kinase